MKKTILLSSIVALSATTVRSNAQTIAVPNGGFETWSIVSGVEKPSGGWVVSDEMGIGCSPLSSTKTTDTASGSYALYLETSNCPGAGGLHEGFAFNTFGITAKPTQLRIKYKSTRVADSADIDIKMIKRVGGTQTIVGHTKYKIGNTVATYTALSIPIIYTDTINAPDTAQVTFESDDLSTTTLGNKLWIDEVSFWKPSVTTGINEVANTGLANATAYPVPAKGSVNLQYELTTTGTIKAQLYNIHGSMITSAIWENMSAGAHTHTTDISGLAPGIYYYQLQQDNAQTTMVKIIKE